MAVTQLVTLRISETDGTRYLVATLKDATFEEGERVYIADLDADIDVDTAVTALFDELVLLI